VQRTDDIVMIQITLNQRTQAVKVALYKAIADRLAKNPGVRPGDVLISLIPPSPPRTGRSATAKRSTLKLTLYSGFCLGPLIG